MIVKEEQAEQKLQQKLQQKEQQQELSFPRKPGWPRPGPGRKPYGRSTVWHRSRGKVSGCHPMHVTLRVREGVPGLRTGRFIRAFRTTLGMCVHRTGFRVVHYSVQHNHVHLLIEADDADKLGCGMKSLGARFARAVNRVFGRSGQVLKERYHMRALKTPKEVRHALAYVLLNARKHFRERHGRKPPVRFDGLSSAVWFDGWKRGWDPGPPGRLAEVSPAASWLLSTGWRRHRLISPEEVPGCGASLRPAAANGQLLL